MRPLNSTPAVQLGSAAHRYAFERRHPTWTRPAKTAVDAQPARGSAATKEGGPRDERVLRLEAVLFLAREPLASRKLAQYANLADGTEARTLIRQLNEHYDGVGRAFRVEEIAGGFQLLTRPQFAPWLRRLAHVPRETRLSAPALETLAVVAYRQPVPKSTVDAIRGVNCGEILRQLLERDLVRIDGRGDELGRPYLYSTTRHFLQLFGLSSLEELPRRGATGQPILVEPAGTSQPTTPAASLLSEEANVKVIFPPDLHPDDLLPETLPYGEGTFVAPRAADEDDDDDFEDDDEEDDDVDDDDDDADEEEEEGDEDLDEDFDDDFDDEEDDDEEEDEDDSDLEEADWEEVDDEDDEEEDDDDDDDDLDDDDEEEEEEDDDDE